MAFIALKELEKCVGIRECVSYQWDFRNHILFLQGKAGSSSKHATYGHKGRGKGRNFRNCATWGQGKTGNSSKHAICGHMVAGKSRSIKLCPKWARQDWEFHPRCHRWAYVGGEKGEVSYTMPWCWARRSPSKHAIYGWDKGWSLGSHTLYSHSHVT